MCLEGYYSLGICGYLEINEAVRVAQIISFPGELQGDVRVFGRYIIISEWIDDLLSLMGKPQTGCL